MGFQPGQNLYTQGFGSYPENIEVPFISDRSPTINDILFPIGKHWLKKGVGEYVLVSFTNTLGVITANWVTQSSDEGIQFINTYSNDVNVDPDANGRVNFTSTGGTIIINGSDGGLGLQNINFDTSLTKPAFDAINIVTAFSTPGTTTYTPTSGMKYCIVEVIGGGGGGGGVGATASGFVAIGGGGGSGSYARGLFTSTSIGVGQSLTIGAGGTGGSNIGGTGGTGGSTIFGTAPLITCTGGIGGIGTTTSSSVTTSGGAGGTASGSGISFSTIGNSGACGFGINTGLVYIIVSGCGANSFYGNGGESQNANVAASSAGNIGVFGGGGSGALSNAGSENVGGVGGSGLIIITEFLSV